MIRCVEYDADEESRQDKLGDESDGFPVNSRERHKVPYRVGRKSFAQELVRDQDADDCAKELGHHVANGIPAVYSAEPKIRERDRRIKMSSRPTTEWRTDD